MAILASHSEAPGSGETMPKMLYIRVTSDRLSDSFSFKFPAFIRESVSVVSVPSYHLPR
jgi:hypothetical protein